MAAIFGPGLKAGASEENGTRKTRVLFVNDHLGWGTQVHGVTRLFEIWASYLPPDRYEALVCILNRPSSLGRSLEERGVRTIFLPVGKYNPFTPLFLARLISREKIDILHLQGYRSVAFGKIAAKLTGIATVIHFHDMTENYPPVQKLIDFVSGRYGDVFLAVSRSTRSCWAKRSHLPEEQVRVIYNCVSCSEFREPSEIEMAESRLRLGIPANAKVVGTITRFFSGKGTRYLLEAAPMVLERFPDTYFLIVGDGPDRADLEKTADALGLGDRVRFLGFIEKVQPVLAAFHISVLTSYIESGSPLPVIESMCMAKPVIATGVVEILEDGVTGIVIPPKNPELLAESILSLLSDETYAASLARAAKKASERFDVTSYVTELSRIYDSLTGDPPPAF